MTHTSKQLKPQVAQDWLEVVRSSPRHQQQSDQHGPWSSANGASALTAAADQNQGTPPTTTTAAAGWSVSSTTTATTATTRNIDRSLSRGQGQRPRYGLSSATTTRYSNPSRAERGKWTIQFRHSNEPPPPPEVTAAWARTGTGTGASTDSKENVVRPPRVYGSVPPPPPPQQQQQLAAEPEERRRHSPPGPTAPVPATAAAAAAADANEDEDAAAEQGRRCLRPFVPQELSDKMPRVLLDPTWPGFKVSALCLGTFDERGLGSFSVERDTQIQQGLMDFAVTTTKGGGVMGGRKGTVGIGGYAFEGFPGIKVSFPAGTISSLYYSPAPAAPDDQDQNLERFYFVIGTRWTPRFYAYITTRPDRHVTSQVRVSALDHQHARQVPYLSRHFLVVLDLVRESPSSSRSTTATAEPPPPSRGSLRDFYRHCELNGLPVPKRIDNLEVFKEKRYGKDMRSRIEYALSTLSPTHAYHLEGILRDGTLSPYELHWLIEKHVKVWNVTVELDRDSFVEDILIELRNLLVEDRKARAELFSLGACTPKQLQEMQVEVSDMADRAREAVLERARVKLDEPVRIGGGVGLGVGGKETDREKIDARKHFWCRNITLTPSGTIKVGGRTLEKSNATIRRYYHDVDTHRESDHFLRVAFRDEDGQNLQVVAAGETGLAQRRLLDASVTTALKTGISFAGRRYDFLAYSQSGLRDRSVWFVAPWSDVDRNGKPYTIEAETIRQQLGLFDKISRMPAKLGARFSQGFTASIATVYLHHTKIGSRPDIAEYEEDGSELTNHTDGAGVMSEQLRDQVWQALQTNGFRRDQDGPPPSVYQIRLGGSKGVLAVDSSLEGMQVQLRPSQDKFQGFADRIGGDKFCLNVSDAFTRPNPLRLNRPLISALDDLGVPTEVFLAYQKLAIDELSPEALYTFRGAYDTLNRFSYGGATKFKRSFAPLVKVLRDLGSFDDRLLQEEPFLRAALDVVRVRCLRDLKDRARIPLPDSYVLVGVPDEDRLLEPDQVYACLRFPDQPEEPVYLKGTVVVTRSPAMDPGDIRILQAVGELPSGLTTRMRALENCLVLPTQGVRSVASMMGGGDLDGDTYQVITLQDLIPSDVAPPRSHESQPPYELDRPAKIEDVGDCFVNYLCNDTVGQIAHMHLCLADRSPQHGFDPRCQKLADLYSLAVDAPKTGNVVPASALPRIKGSKERPDFMRKSDIEECCVPADVEYYKSNRALGYLYRSIDDDGVATPTGMLSPALEDGLSDSSARLHIIVKHDLATIFDASPEILRSLVQRHEAKISPIIKAFVAGLNDVAVTHTPARSDGRKLSEVKIFAVATLLKVQRGEAARGNAVAAMNQQVAALTEWLETSLTGPKVDARHTDVDSLELRYAAWRVAQEMSTSGDDNDDAAGGGGTCPFGQKTARWVCLTLLLEAIRAEQVRKDDLSLGITRAPEVAPRSRILQPAFATPTSSKEHHRLDLLLTPESLPSSSRSNELSASSLRRESIPSSGSAKPAIPYATRPRPAWSVSTVPTSEEVPSPISSNKRGGGREEPPADLVTEEFERRRRQRTAAAALAPAAGMSSRETRSSLREGESEDGVSSEAGYVASILGGHLDSSSSNNNKKMQLHASSSNSRKFRPPPTQARLAEEKEEEESDGDSSDSDVLEAKQARALQSFRYEMQEIERLRDEAEARERLYEEFRRRARLRGIHVPSRTHDPEAYRIHRADFMASMGTRGEEDAQAQRPSAVRQEEYPEPPESPSMRMAPATTDTGTREPAPERPRPPPTLISPQQQQQPTYAHGWPSSEAETRRWREEGEEKAPEQRGQWQGGESAWAAAAADRSGPETGGGGSYAPPWGNADEASSWPTRPPSPSAWVSAPLAPTMTPPPSGGRRFQTTAAAPFWTRFDDVDKARYKSNQTGLAKIGRMMVTSSGRSFREAYGVGKIPSRSGGRGYSVRREDGGRRWYGSGTETSWLQETEAQLQQDGGARVEAWGWGGGGGGTGSEVSGWTAR